MSRLGSYINDIVSLGDEIEMMLDDDDGVPFINKAVEDALQEFHIGGMETDGRFLKDVEGAAAPGHPDAF